MKDTIKEKTWNWLKNLSNEPAMQEMTLIGGTALSLKLDHRISKDLDFFCWSAYPGAQFELKSRNQLIDVVFKYDSNTKIEFWDKKQVQLLSSDGIKIEFFADSQVNKPSKKEVLIGYINTVSLEYLAALKINNIGFFRREKFRDIYDLYIIFKDSIDVKEMSLVFSQIHKKEKYLGNALRMLTDLEFIKNCMLSDKDFKLLNAKFEIHPEDVVALFTPVLALLKEKENFKANTKGMNL